MPKKVTNGLIERSEDAAYILKEDFSIHPGARKTQDNDKEVGGKLILPLLVDNFNSSGDFYFLWSNGEEKLF